MSEQRKFPRWNSEGLQSLANISFGTDSLILWHVYKDYVSFRVYDDRELTSWAMGTFQNDVSVLMGRLVEVRIRHRDGDLFLEVAYK